MLNLAPNMEMGHYIHRMNTKMYFEALDCIGGEERRWKREKVNNRNL